MKPWTQDENARLMMYRMQRVPVAKIADLLGRSVPSVAQQVRRMNLAVSPRKPWRTLEDARLRSLVGTGLSWTQIAEQMGRTVVSCTHRARALKIGGTRVRKNWTTAELADLEQAVFAVVNSHSLRHQRPASAVRCKAMSLLCKFAQKQAEEVA